MSVSATTDAGFEQDVIQATTPVLVDFWAEWCGPCKALAPKLDEIAKELDGKINVVKVNIDENPDAPAKYGVRGIPTMILFKGGENVEQIVGNHPKENIVESISKHI